MSSFCFHSFTSGYWQQNNLHVGMFESSQVRTFVLDVSKMRTFWSDSIFDIGTGIQRRDGLAYMYTLRRTYTQIIRNARHCEDIGSWRNQKRCRERRSARSEENENYADAVEDRRATTGQYILSLQIFVLSISTAGDLFVLSMSPCIACMSPGVSSVRNLNRLSLSARIVLFIILRKRRYI